MKPFKRMNQSEKLDYTLKMLYNDQSAVTGLIEGFLNNHQTVLLTELSQIVEILETQKFAVFQIDRDGDYRGKLTDHGTLFLKTSSFSIPGTSILNH